jgi:hypothetical protein
MCERMEEVFRLTWQKELQQTSITSSSPSGKWRFVALYSTSIYHYIEVPYQDKRTGLFTVLPSWQWLVQWYG